MIKKTFKKITSLSNYDTVKQLSGGISNQNYRVISNNPIYEDLVLTIYSDPESWWKADKELRIAKLYGKYGIPSAEILNNGYFDDNGNTYRYSLRKFIKEKDLSVLLCKDKKLRAEDWQTLLSQLGVIMKTIHSIPMNGYGLLSESSISGSDFSLIPSSSTWQEYVGRLILNRKPLVEKLNRKKTIGNISGADVKNIFSASYEFYKQNRGVLESVNKSKLIHYDVLLSNIIVGRNDHLNRCEITAIIDNEWVSAGDPDIDLVQLENTAYFSSERKTFKKYWSYFTKAYLGKNSYSKDIHKKRNIYHMMRSLFYIIAVFNLSSLENIDAKKIEKNYELVNKIINGSKIGFSLFE